MGATYPELCLGVASLNGAGRFSPTPEQAEALRLAAEVRSLLTTYYLRLPTRYWLPTTTCAPPAHHLRTTCALPAHHLRATFVPPTYRHRNPLLNAAPLTYCSSPYSLQATAARGALRIAFDEAVTKLAAALQRGAANAGLFMTKQPLRIKQAPRQVYHLVLTTTRLTANYS